MKFWVGVTDKRWFDFLSKIQPDEVNFWRPSSTLNFKAIKPGEPFLFKLHSPNNFIVGGGFYVRHTTLPLSIAWEVFGEKNGTPNKDMLHKRITQYRKGFEPDPIIGCTVLTEPFFFDESDWIPMPRDWSPNIVVGKRYDPNEAIGMEIWTHVSERLQSQDLSETKAVEVSEEPERYGSLYLAMGRIGQGAFRVLVTDAYNRRCAISGERTLPVLQASHIKPYVESGPNKISNGLLLRSDLHILFDRGYVTITNDYRVEVSKRIKAEFENGRDYYTFHGQKLTVLPIREYEKPSIEFIEWHNQHVYAS